MINWNDLRHFLAIAREGSIGAAASSLKVNQSTTQRRLLALEKGLGCVLVERHGTGYRLTSQGQVLIASVTNVEAAVDAVRRRAAFHARHPGTRVELLMEQRILDLSKGEADIAIRGGKPGSGALICRKIAEVPWGIYASRAFVAQHGSPATPADIGHFPIIELVDELEDVSAVRWMTAHAGQARIAARCANVPSAHLAVKSGAGLAALPTVYAATDTDLMNLLGPLPELNYPMFLVTHKDIRKRPGVNAFFDFCRQELKSVLLRGMMGEGSGLME